MNKKRIIPILALTIISGMAWGQLENIDPEYLNTLNKRTEKIVKDLGLNNHAQEKRVQEIMVIQYYQLSLIHDNRDQCLENIKDKTEKNKEDSKLRIAEKTNAALYKLHAAYLASLSAELSQDQVEIIKDGMTYGVLKHTYQGYLNLLPDLSEDQKRFIYKNLAEARELAMDGGSSKEKHAWFGKYKGRINNYLSEEGYDLKKAEEEMRERNKNNATNN